MTLTTMFLTRDPQIARIAEQSGVDWIFVDLERIGKVDRQGHLDTVISDHSVEDVRAVRAVVDAARLLVRVDPIHPGSAEQVDEVIDAGADVVMLPYFRSAREVREFVGLVDGRAEVCLLLETREAAESIDEVLAVDGIDHVHIGLNDLRLSWGRQFMFELLADSTVEQLCRRIGQAGVPYGFGGVGRLGAGDLPAELILGEHYRLGSSMVILSRSFCDASKQPREVVSEQLPREVARLRELEAVLADSDAKFFEKNRAEVVSQVRTIVARKEAAATQQGETVR